MKKDLLGLKDISAKEIENILETAGTMKLILGQPNKKTPHLQGKTVVNLFYENSTRTRLSFELAAKYMSANAANITASGSSVQKGETLIDTAETINAMGTDILVMRHNMSGAPHLIAPLVSASVINAGDGGHNHPSQTLIDMMTIRQLKGRLDHLTIGFCGDLKFGRTVHSLVNSLVRFPGNTFYFISPDELRVPEYLVEDTLKPSNTTYHEVTDLEATIPKLDVLYMTRVQKERFFNEEDYVRLKDFYILTAKKMKLAPPDMLVLHPLPRVNEISVDVDDDPRAVYFKQAQYAVYVRMALILTL